MGLKIMNRKSYKTDLPVIISPQTTGKSAGRFRVTLKPWHGLILALICIFSSTAAYAAADPLKTSILEVLMRWMPLLLKGFIHLIKFIY